MIIISLFVLFYKKSDKAAIKFSHAYSRTNVPIEIINHPLNSLDRNIGEEINFRAHNILLVTHQFVCNDIFL